MGSGCQGDEVPPLKALEEAPGADTDSMGDSMGERGLNPHGVPGGKPPPNGIPAESAATPPGAPASDADALVAENKGENPCAICIHKL